MKKIYVMAAFLGATSFAFNQVAQKAPSHLTLNTEKAISENNGAVKAPGVPIWSSDFSTASDWAINGNGNQGTWQIGVAAALPNPNYYSTITSTTAANGFAFFEGVQYLLAGTVDSQNAWITMANSIDCSAHDIVTFKFEQEYRAFNTDRTYVEVSLDGGNTWVQTVDVNLGITANSYSPNKVVYQNFNVNNSPTVKFRFRWENTSNDPNYGSGYAWQVDDVQISTLADHDIALNNLYYGSLGLFYHQIPVAQIAPIESSATFTNKGSVDQTNVVFTANETVVGAYTSSSAPATIVSQGSDSLVVANNFTPSGAGNYKLEYAVTYNNVDDVPSNNVFRSYKFNVGQHIYARDTSTQAAAGTVYGQMSGSNTPELIEAGNVYDIYTNANLTGISFQLGNVIEVGSLVYGVIYDNNIDAIPNGETKPYEVKAGDEGKYITLAYETPVNLSAGQTYIVTVKCFETNFSIATGGRSAAQTSFVYYPAEDTWYYTTSTPVVRMNFDPSLSLENNELSNLNVSQNFPNPFANETTIEFNLKEAAAVSYKVVDLTGKVIAEASEGKTMAGDHSITIDGTSFANGVYYLNLTAGESTVTRKMIVNK